MKNHNLIIICILFVFAFTGCEKEGPYFSFRSPDRRLNGVWEIVEFNINNNDSLSLLIKTFGNNIYISSFIIDSDNGDSFGFGGNEKESNYCLWGNWEFSNKLKTDIKVEYHPASACGFAVQDTVIEALGAFNMGCNDVWKIIKLSNHEFIFESNFEENNYYLRLIKIKS